MLDLDHNCPKSASCKMCFQTFFAHFFCLLKHTTSYKSHNCFKLDFPLAFAHVCNTFDDLYSSFIIVYHLKIFWILQKCYTLLFSWSFDTSSLNTQSGLIHISLILHDPWSNEPELPLAAFWTISYSFFKVLIGLLVFTDSIIDLCKFYIYFPLELPWIIFQHVHDH